MPLAHRTVGCRLHVLYEEETGRVRSIEMDGSLQWLRVCPDLCEIPLFDEMADLAYDEEAPSGCMAGKSVWLHDLGCSMASGRQRPTPRLARPSA